MIKIAICEDEEESRSRLKGQLEQYLSMRCLDYEIRCFRDGISLLDELHSFASDLIFLDIYMRDLNGVQTAEKIREFDKQVKIVFTTSSPDFALQSYQVYAFGYLLKPINGDKLAPVMDRMLESDPCQANSIIVKIGCEIRRFYYDEIVYIESLAKKLLLHDKDGGTTEFYGKLNDIQGLLDERFFLRSHQSYLVNMSYIRSAKDVFTLSDGSLIPITTKDRKAIREQYFEYAIALGSRSAAR